MSHHLTLRRGLLALGASLLMAGAVAAQDIPRVDPAKCNVAQPEITPLQPLTIVTPKGRTNLMVEYAGTEKQKQYGLMCRKVVPADRGMLFDFHAPQQNMAFWMRNTIIPLDLVYIRPDGSVLSIARNARPLDDSPIPAGGVARWVLELAAGRAAQIGVLPGDKILHKTMPTK